MEDKVLVGGIADSETLGWLQNITDQRKGDCLGGVVRKMAEGCTSPVGRGLGGSAHRNHQSEGGWGFMWARLVGKITRLGVGGRGVLSCLGVVRGSHAYIGG